MAAADLTPTGTLTYAAGKFTNAVDVTNGYFTNADGSIYKAAAVTIEFWAKTFSASGYQIVFGRANAEWFGFLDGKPASTTYTGGTSMADGAWHHYAWSLDGTTIKCFVDGVQVLSSGSGQNPANWDSRKCHVGRWASNADGSNPAYPFQGQVDEMRVSKVLRYTAPFTAPTAAFTGDANTLALYHFESDGLDSSAAAAATPTAPGAPTGLSATPASGQVALAWTAPASTGGAAITDYLVEYQPSGGAWTTFADGVSTTTGATVTGLTNGTAYLFRVSAINSAGTSTPSSTASATPAVPAADTTAPTISTFTATPGSGQVSLAWAGSDNVGITRWLLRRAGTTVYDGAATSYTDTGLTNGTAYSYSLVAYDAAGNTSSTSTASATPAAAATGVIPPTDVGITYSPYTWDITSTRAMTTCSGAYLRTEVIGSPTAITATFDTSGFSGQCELVITVDDAPPVIANLAASVSIAIPTTNPWPKHVVEILIRRLSGSAKWTSPTTAVKFTGFTLAPTSGSVVAPRARPWHLLCFGDSLAEGYSTRANAVSDTRYGWAYPLRDLLGAQVGVVGYSAAGITKGGEGAVPALTASYNQLYDGVARSFTAGGEPHIAVIHYGTNDNGADITSAATTVLNGILAATTNTKIAVVQQWNGTLNKTAWQNAIAASSAPARCTYIDTTGWLNATTDSPDNLHPYGYANLADLSPRLAAALAPLLTGTTAAATPTYRRFINKAGVAVGIS